VHFCTGMENGCMTRCFMKPVQYVASHQNFWTDSYPPRESSRLFWRPSPQEMVRRGTFPKNGSTLAWIRRTYEWPFPFEGQEQEHCFTIGYSILIHWQCCLCVGPLLARLSMLLSAAVGYTVALRVNEDDEYIRLRLRVALLPPELGWCGQYHRRSVL